jgi:uncharacterized protein YcfJ
VEAYSITRRVKAAQGDNVNNTVLATIIVGGVVVAAAAGIAVNSGYNPLQKYATVVNVEPAFDSTRTPRVVCGDEATLAAAQAQAQASSVAPQSGEGAPSATPESSLPQEPQTEQPAAKAGEEAVPQCLTVFETSSVEAGFDVTYELDGTQRVVRMDRDPGRRIPVEDGELVLTPS